jgi:hypothetical protein
LIGRVSFLIHSYQIAKTVNFLNSFYHKFDDDSTVIDKTNIGELRETILCRVVQCVNHNLLYYINIDKFSFLSFGFSKYVTIK